ncbi:hypothetical protein EX895_001113 [Sporisorium graminicola]|uniref:Protein YAE1 n=1 Tax=Sporisorium graminicola TaxID=280036 RepID=A0A4U7KZI1_9BASI|nr:hypothetical protein EX895_001113 [Sporisorium graminicola]TKY89816.1 hypothetical protein EX895_001113 [Sporisorium graminicola]
MDPSASSSSSHQEADSLKTPQMDQSEWSSSSAFATPTSSTSSLKTFPRRLSLLQNDTSASPVRTTSSDDSTRRTSFTGPKPLNLASQPVSSAGSTETPKQSKRSSISYIPSPSTSVRTDDGGLSRALSTSSASGRTRTGSISRATAAAGSSAAAARRRPSQASQTNSDADDWLMNDHDASSSAAARSMAERDSAKVEALFNDVRIPGDSQSLTGYREGITAGKLSSLQSGFDQGFNEVGATLGRQVGVLRGQVAALLLLTSSSSLPTSTSVSSNAAAGAGRKVLTRTRGFNSGPTAAAAAGARHDRPSELETQNSQRVTSRRTLSLSSDESSTSRDLLHLIAEKERRCFELREELSAEEAQLKQLRSTWQRMATKELAYSTSSPTATLGASHRRDGSTTSSTSDVATDAWNSFSSKLPGSFKTQLNNLNTLLESIANPEGAAPEPIEKQSPLQNKSLPLPGGSETGMLRPTGGGLGVLEEEGSDVGSVVSPRSPRSPAILPHSDSSSANTTLVAPRSGSELAAVAKQDSQALGFSVDANGIAHPQLGAIADHDNGPPTPPKPPLARNNSGSSGGAWTSRRTSVLGSLSGLQSKLVPPSTSDTADQEGGGGGFASMFAKRFKEARDNASDMLREAERKLGNAMTIDDLLGTKSPPSQPQITLDEASTDTNPVPSPWYEAAGGRRSTSERNLSPSLAPVDSERRGSISSDRSSSSLSAPARVGSPHASPVIGGAPGAAGVFGMILGSQTETGGRQSGDSWAWSGREDEDEDGWDEEETKKK